MGLLSTPLTWSSLDQSVEETKMSSITATQHKLMYRRIQGTHKHRNMNLTQEEAVHSGALVKLIKSRRIHVCEKIQPIQRNAPKKKKNNNANLSTKLLAHNAIVVDNRNILPL